MKVAPEYNGRVDRPGMAYQTPADDSGALPSSRTLNPIAARARGVDDDPLAPKQVLNLNLKTWRIK